MLDDSQLKIIGRYLKQLKFLKSKGDFCKSSNQEEVEELGQIALSNFYLKVLQSELVCGFLITNAFLIFVIIICDEENASTDGEHDRSPLSSPDIPLMTGATPPS